MTQEEKQDLLADIFDCDPGALGPDVRLDTLTWDSMAKLSLIALVKAKFDRKLPGAEIRQFQTVGDVFNVMEKV